MRAASFLHHEHLAYGRPGLRRLGAVDRQVLEAQVGPYPEHVAGTLRRVLRAGTDPAEDGPVPTVTPDTEHTAPGELPSAVLGDGRRRRPWQRRDMRQRSRRPLDVHDGCGRRGGGGAAERTLRGSRAAPRVPRCGELEASGRRRLLDQASARERAASFRIRHRPGRRPRTRAARAGQPGHRASTRRP